jgi:hypothetical protein
MTTFDRVSGEITRNTRLIRELCKERLREPELSQVHVALAFIEGAAFAITSHNDVRPEPVAEKPKGKAKA